MSAAAPVSRAAKCALWAGLLVAAASPTQPVMAAQAAPSAVLAPFSARYEADWKSIPVGYSDIELKPDGAPGRYVYTWSITARGVFRLLYANGVTQTSWIVVEDGRVRPQRYVGVEGSSSVELAFDWQRHRATGTSEKKPVDFSLAAGAQDFNSIQVQVMLDLKSGRLPQTFQIVDKDELKEFNYTKEGTATIQTAIGALDTIVVASQRTGNSRVLRMWFAPSLGYLPVQAERTRDGKLEFAMRIKSVKRQ